MNMDMEEQKTLDQWVTYLSELDLPLLKNSREDLEAMGSYEDVSITKLSNIALTDPGLTLTILRAACSLPRSRLQDEIHTIDAAAMKLGSAGITTTVEAMCFIEDCLDEADKTLYMQIVARAYHAAYQAYGFARERVDMAPEELFTAAMLSDIGALMLLVHGDGVLAKCSTPDDIDNQKEMLGFSLSQLSQALAKHWKLSTFIIQSMEKQDETGRINPRLYEVQLASDLALSAEKGWQTEEMQILVEKVAAHLRCDVEEAVMGVRDNAIHSADETVFYGVTPAAASLPELDDDVLNSFRPISIDDNNENDVTPPHRHNKPTAPLSQHSKAQIPPASLAPTDEAHSPLNHAIFDRALQDLKFHLAGEFNLTEFMGLLRRGFQDGLKLNRAFFAMLDQDKKNLICRFVFGNETGLRNLRIPVNNHNLFQRLLEKPQAIRCREENVKKVIPLIPKEFYKLIDTNQFFVMTIRAKGKPLGMVYVDRYGNDYGLDQTDYEKLCQLCLLLSKGFERIGR